MSGAAEESSKSRWSQRWSEGRTEWHRPSFHPGLLEFSKRVEKGPNKRVFIPLCGKALELKWFYDEGYSVVGVELCEQAASEFFEEQGIPYVVLKGSSGPIYQSKDGKLIIHIGNLFEIDLKDLGIFDVIWDRASFSATETSKQERYINIMTEICNNNGSYMLVACVHYSKVLKFPVSLSIEAVGEIFEGSFKVELLKSYTAEEEGGRPQSEEFKDSSFNLFLLTKKP